MKRPVAASILSLMVVGSTIAGPVTTARAGSLPPSEWVVGPQKRVAFITFDGHTKADKLVKLSTILKTKNARASFFIPAQWIAHHKAKSRLVHLAGNAFGNRGWDNGSFLAKSDEQIRASLTRAQKTLNSIKAYPHPFFRPPAGKRDLRVLRDAAALGYRSVLWTMRVGGGTVKHVAHRAVHNAQGGSIISLDLWRASNRKALPKIIDGLRRKGFALRTIDHLKRSHAVRWDVTLKYGSAGDEVAYAERTLRSITYPAGAVDGKFGYAMEQATWAFEKYHGMARDATITPQEMEAIATSHRPQTPKRGPKNFVDVDISRQVLREVHKGRVTHTLPVSSGGEYQYESDGNTYTAHTPRGNFTIERKIPGWRTSRLGRLWYPSYFYSGFAIHGEPEVPPYPVSHGCVRIPMYVTKGFYYRNPIGTPVYIHD
ncbi:MAG: polysaccharide deacetylase family protein [Actinomycetota bacterium]|nr:polysaccharide deacetylase family protein [Actinomycetota bacterium]